MILNFEMSTVASMCRNTAASRNSFSIPKSSMMPLPPWSSTACCATLKTSSDANNFTMLHSSSASGARSSTARDAHAQVFRGLDDLAGLEVDPGLRERLVLHQQVVLGQAHILEHELAVIHEAAAERLVAARDGEARGAARHEEAGS